MSDPTSGRPGARRLPPAEEKLILGLHRRAVREERGLFLAEGVRVVEELVRSPIALELAVVSATAESHSREGAITTELEARCVVRRVAESVVRRVAGTDSPQGVLVVARIPELLLDELTMPVRATALVLDGVQDPGNFGTLVRSAYAFGVDLVIAMTGTVDPWNPKAVRAAAGASFQTRIATAQTDDALAWLKAQRFTIFASDARGSPVEAAHRGDRVALVVGNEGAGIGQAVAEAADARIAVPMRGSAESLNVAVAAGILLYVITRENR